MDQQSAIDLLCKIINKNPPQDILRIELKNLSKEDWKELQDHAIHQDLTLILYKHIKMLKLNDMIPHFVQGSLRETYLKATARNMRIQHHASVILNEIRKQNIDIIALKGIYLIEAIYSNIGLRTFGDLDFLVRKADIPNVLTIMKDLGYETITYYNPKDDNQDIKHIPIMRKKDSPDVEMHWGILEENEPFDIDMDGIWRRAIAVNVAGVDVHALGFEDLIVHLCVHFTYQHRLRAGLGWLYDIAEVIQKFHAKIDWQKMVTISKDWGVERVVWLTLYLLEEIFGFEVPEEILRQLIPEPIDPTILEKAGEILFSRGKGGIRFTPDLVALSDANGLVPKIVVIFRRIFLPRQAMERIYNITPNTLEIYKYYIIRFRGLFRNYAKFVWQLFYKGDNDILAGIDLEKASITLRHWQSKVE